MRTILFLINPRAGLHFYRPVLKLIQEQFTAPDWQASTRILASRGEAFVLCEKAAAEGVWAVVIVGGDGTINDAARALAGTATRLGVIPAGTGNGLARGLGIPLKAAQACRVIAAGHERRVDTGWVNGQHCFANICGVGYDAWIAKTANDLRWLSRFNGLARYLVSGALSLARYRPQNMRITTPQRQWEQAAMLLAISNTPQYGLNAVIAPGADPCDGLLNLVVVPPLGPLEFAQCLSGLFSGRPLRPASYYSVASVRVECLDPTPAYLHVDGEPAGTLPLEASIKPKSLTVLVP